MRVAVASSSLVSTDAIESLTQWPEIEIISIVTNPDKASGRGQKLSANLLAQWAADKGLAVCKPSSESELIEMLLKDQIELLITIAYGHILSLPILQAPKYGCINLHYSMLPYYRGAAPVQRALLNGDTKTGISVFILNQGMDSGPILRQQEIEIDQDDSTNSLLKKLSGLSGHLLKESIAAIKNDEKGIAQSDDARSYAPKILKEEGRIIWSSSAIDIYNKFRALHENPGVYTELNGERVRINQMNKTILSLKSPAQLQLFDGQLLVATNDMAIQLLSLTPEGRREMSGVDFYNGLKEKSGLRFA